MCFSLAAPSSLRSTPAVFCAASFLPAVRPIKSPGFNPRAAMTVSLRSCKNLEIPPTNSPFSSSLNQYALLAVCTSTSAQIPSITFLVAVNPSTTTAFMVCPSNGPNPQSAMTSVASCNTRSMRRSGLSVPYLSMDSRYGIRTNGALEAVLYTPYFSNTGGSTSSTTENTSSWEANAISISS